LLIFETGDPKRFNQKMLMARGDRENSLKTLPTWQ
jgi:hypothetical protein